MSGSSPHPSVSLSDEVFELPLSARWYNVLMRAGIRTVGQLVESTAEELGRYRGIGEKSIDELERCLAAHGLKLATVRTTPRPPRPASPAFQAATPPPALVPLSAPPEPGLERARWLGAQITDLTADWVDGGPTEPKLAPHTARRAAARAALARVDGYEPTRPVEDALYLGGASLILAGLNEYARRVLDEGEAPSTDDDEEAGHAVL